MVLSVILATASVCYIDSAYMLFRMIQTEAIIAEGGRWMNAVPQLLPWLFIKAGAPLPVIIAVFALSYILILYFIFLIAGKIYEQVQLAALLPLLLIAGTPHTFFDTITETKYALAFAILLIAALVSGKSFKGLDVILIVACGLFSHPVFIIYWAIILIWLAVENGFKSILLPLISGVALLAVRYFFAGGTGYEVNLLSDASVNNLALFGTSFIHHYMSIWEQWIYWPLILIMLLSTGYFLFKKSTSQLLLYIGMLAGIYCLLALVYAKGDSHMMIQKTMFLFHFAILFPMAASIKCAGKKITTLWISIVVIAMITGFFGLYTTAPQYIQRRNNLVKFMEAMPKNTDKFLIRETQINHEVMMATWALPHETLLLSGAASNKSIVVKNVRDHNDTLQLSKYPTAFRPAFGYPIPSDSLNAKYFKLNETFRNEWLDSTIILGN